MGSAGNGGLLSPARVPALLFLAVCLVDASASASDVRITGRVESASGQPAGGARVRALIDLGLGPLDLAEGTSGVEVLSDPMGRFSITLASADADEAFALHAEREGDGAAIVRRRRPDESGSIDLGVVRLLRPIAIRGRVVDEDGSPIAEARVRPGTTYDGAHIPFVDVRTEPDGTFAIPCVTGAGAALLDADAPGFGPSMSGEVYPGGAPVTIVLPKGVAIRGTVRTPEGEPIAGATVALDLHLFRISHSWNEFPRESPRTVTTSDDGSFALGDLAPGTIHVRAIAPAFRVASAATTVAEGEEGRVDFVLEPAELVSGVVVDRATGEPIEGAVINGDVRSGPDGRFTTRAEYGYGLVALEGLIFSVTRAGYAPFHFTHASESVTPEVRIELDPAAAIRGIVLDPDGRPLPGATVFVEPDAESWKSRHGDRYPSSIYAATAIDGTFESPAVEPGRYSLVTVMHSAYPELESAGFDVAAGETHELELVMGAGRELRGRLVESGSRRPVVGGEVLFWREMTVSEGRPPVWIVQCRATSGADGTFSVRGLREPSVRISTFAEGYAPVALDVALAESATRPQAPAIEIALEAGATYEGTIVDSNGEALEGASITLEPVSPHGFERQFGRFLQMTDAEGRFRFTSLPNGPMTILASPPFDIEALARPPFDMKDSPSASLHLGVILPWAPTRLVLPMEKSPR